MYINRVCDFCHLQSFRTWLNSLPKEPLKSKGKPYDPQKSPIIPQKSPTYMHTSRVLLLPLPIILPTQKQCDLQKSPINSQKSFTYMHISRVLFLLLPIMSHLTTPAHKKSPINLQKSPANVQSTVHISRMLLLMFSLSLCTGLHIPTQEQFKLAKEPYKCKHFQSFRTWQQYHHNNLSWKICLVTNSYICANTYILAQILGANFVEQIPTYGEAQQYVLFDGATIPTQQYSQYVVHVYTHLCALQQYTHPAKEQYLHLRRAFLQIYIYVGLFCRFTYM